jgi:AraC-like DNA-binding protein
MVLSYPRPSLVPVLVRRVLMESPFARVTTVGCPGLPTCGPEEHVTGAAVVLVRRGVFLRRADGRSALADVTTGYLQRPGESQRIAHPAGGDVCTAIAIPDDLADRFAHAGRVIVSPAADLAHRRLLAAGGRSPDAAADLIAALLPAPRELPPPPPLIDDVRALLHTDPDRDLTALAAAVGWSPWHLSRTFHRATGSTLSAYRRRLRVRAALDQIAGTAPPHLATVAVRTGFADQAHMTRAIRAETGTTPAALHRDLAKLEERATRIELA